MGHTFKYADNVSYGANDINATISQIVTGGVAEVYHDGLNYNTSDLNKIAQFVADWGVNPENNMTLNVTSYTSGKIKVNKGTAFFSDGASVSVDADGVILEYTNGQKNYVYLKNNLSATNSIDVVCSLMEGNGDFVPLAEISPTGEIIDKRKYCKGKLPSYDSDIGKTKIIDVAYDIKGVSSEHKTWETIIDLNGYNYSKVFNISGFVRNSKTWGFGVWDSNTNIYHNFIEGHTALELKRNSEWLHIFFQDSYYGADELLVSFEFLNSENSNSLGYRLKCTFTAIHGSWQSNAPYRDFTGTAQLLVC